MREWDEHGQKLLTLGSDAWRGGRFEEAERLFRQLVGEYPDRPEGYNKLGVSWAERGELDQAEDWFRRALKADSRHAPALTNLGNVLLERGNIDDAMTYYGLALQQDPNYAPAHRNLGIALKRQGHLAEAIRHMRRSDRLALHSDRQDVRRRLRSGMGQALGVRHRTWLWGVVVTVLVLVVLQVIHK